MVVDPAVIESPANPVERVPPPGTDDIMALMRDELRKSTPTEPVESAPEAVTEAAPAPEGDVTPPGVQPGSRRAKTVEKVKTESEQKIADAEAARTAAETRAAEAEAKLQEHQRAPDIEAEQARVAALEAEYGTWVGTPDQYAEAQRLARMDTDDPSWDWERHKAAVANLNTWDDRRKWAGQITDAAKRGGLVEANRGISQDFLVTLAEDLPEDKRDAYRTHKDGIPGAVRFYAETMAAPKLEALEGKLAERDAEIERLKTAGGTRGRSPSPGGLGGGGAPLLDYEKQTPEELMSSELRAQAAKARR